MQQGFAMPFSADPIEAWGPIHPSVYAQTANMVRWAKATARADGTLRYQCPVSGSFVLITDEAALAGVASPRGRLRCMACGEVHLLTQELATDKVPGIVG
jgi:hypothetical protein